MRDRINIDTVTTMVKTRQKRLLNMDLSIQSISYVVKR